MYVAVVLGITFIATLVVRVCECLLFATSSDDIFKSEQFKRDLARRSVGNKDDFHVNGKYIPGVDFTVNDSYAGLLPISDNDAERKAFFWYWPLDDSNDVVFWITGASGCSALLAMMSGYGPFTLPYNTDGSVPNENSWTQLSNIVFLDIPIGVGLSVGTSNITDENVYAAELYGFLINFYATFPELKGMRMWLSGDTYAGTSIPYIVSYLYDQEGNGENADIGINYQGFSMIGPIFESRTVRQDLPSVEFAIKNKDAMGLNATFVQSLVSNARKFKAYHFVKDNLLYPPKDGKISIPAEVLSNDYHPWFDIYEAARESNACFSTYDFRLTCPAPKDQLGIPPGQLYISANNFVNNVNGFIEYIHGDPRSVWYACPLRDVFVGGQGDTSAVPADVEVLQDSIEFGSAMRNVIVQGEKDFILLADGTALALQNTTWFGKQGFQTKPQPFIFDGQQVGTMNNERGVLFARIDDAGHDPAGTTPEALLQLQRYMLGQVNAQDLQM